MCFYTFFFLINVIISFHNTLMTFSILACDIVVFLFDIFLNIPFFVFSLPLDVTISSHNTPWQSRIFLEKILVMPWTTTPKVSPNKMHLQVHFLDIYFQHIQPQTFFNELNHSLFMTEVISFSFHRLEKVQEISDTFIKHDSKKKGKE